MVKAKTELFIICRATIDKKLSKNEIKVLVETMQDEPIGKYYARTFWRSSNDNERRTTTGRETKKGKKQEKVR